MGKKYNPFRPNGLVPPGMFSGRWEETKAIEQCLRQTKNGNPSHFLIEGERGIGKSSLCLVQALVATGELEPLGEKTCMKFIVVSVRLREEDDMFAIIRRISGALKTQIAHHDKLKNYTMKAWDVISRIEIAGFKLNEQSKKGNEDEVLQSLEDDLVNVIQTYGDDFDGILFLIDEADKPPATAQLGLICKLLTEAMSDRRTERLCIGLSGLPATIENLRLSHESSTRLFTVLNLKPLEDHERMEVIEKGMKEAVEKNGFKIEITPEASKAICELSEGYPHFLQEFLYFAFEVDDDDVIDRDDVEKSLTMENGVFDQLGKKYFDNFYVRQIASEAYRHVLKIMSSHMDNWVDRATIIKESGIKETIVDNALRALKARKIIAQNERRKGEYRLPTRSFAVWIRVQQATEATAPEEPGTREHSGD